MKLTPETHASIVKLVNAGTPIKLAANACGIGSRTVMKWLENGRKDDGAREPYKSFADDVDRARGTYAAALSMRINRASDRDWKAAAWILERRYADEYMRREGRELTGRDGGPVRAEVTATEPRHEELAASVGQLLRESSEANE